MARTKRWIAPLAASVLLALGGAAAAAPPQGATMPGGNRTTETAFNHLEQAKVTLGWVSALALSGQNETCVSNIKKAFDDLYGSYEQRAEADRAGEPAAQPGDTPGQDTTRATPAPDRNWRTAFARLERRMDDCGIPRSRFAPRRQDTAGTAGQVGGPKRAPALPHDVMRNLETFRLQVEQFNALANGAGAQPQIR